MITTKTRPRRGRIFPDIQWTETQKSAWKSELENHFQHCQVIFEQVKPKLILTHYNWFMAINPENNDYVIAANEDEVTHLFYHRYADGIPCIFVINETGVAGKL